MGFLADLLKGAYRGTIGVAAFQRPYVWRADDVEALFESLMRGWPVGAFVLWEPSQDEDLSSVSRGRLGPVPAADGARTLLLDGQNRLATLAWAWAGADGVPDGAEAKSPRPSERHGLAE